MRYHISNHAITRILERFGDLIPKEKHAYAFIKDCLADSVEERSFINNTEFMTYAYEKYGYEDYTVRRWGRILFLIRHKMVITVLDTAMFPIRVNKKFKKREEEQPDFEDVDPRLERMVLSGKKF